MGVHRRLGKKLVEKGESGGGEVDVCQKDGWDRGYDKMGGIQSLCLGRGRLRFGQEL